MLDIKYLQRLVNILESYCIMYVYKKCGIIINCFQNKQ